MDQDSKNLDSALDGIAEAKRAKLRRLLLKCAFVTPIVASFGMDALIIGDVAAQGNGSLISDARLKTGAVRIANHDDGFGLYRFRYLWSDIEYVGVIAQEIEEIMPEAVSRGADGFLRVDYKAIGVEMRPYQA